MEGKRNRGCQKVANMLMTPCSECCSQEHMLLAWSTCKESKCYHSIWGFRLQSCNNRIAWGIQAVDKIIFQWHH